MRWCGWCVRAVSHPGARAFVFATSGLPETPLTRFARPLARLLASKGYEVAGSFTCRAFDTWAPFKLVGGTNRQRPNEQDLAAARKFATRLRDDHGPVS
ncbi:hypothetical protein [Streptomyces sp. NPDC051684]|uniref:hypothetical protein n=1 Tax=Streptomyces sp. NPDC051684 TaxID=3365670 RepID=UPI00378A5C55